jgi:hypothetical protein
MVGETKQASSATTAVIYITLGALMTVWSAVYYFYLHRHEGSDIQYVWCFGFFFSGLVLMGIGITLGHIGRAVRAAEVVEGTGGKPPATAPTPPVVTPATPPATTPGTVHPTAAVPTARPAPVAGTPAASPPVAGPTTGRT